MSQLFPKRSRTDLKNKFKREERLNLAKVQLAMQGKLNFEAEPFPELEDEKKREKEEKEDRVRAVSAEMTPVCDRQLLFLFEIIGAAVC